MAKKRFTEIRLGALTARLEEEMTRYNTFMDGNIQLFQAGKRTARETLRSHRFCVTHFLRLERNYHRAIQAANRIDRCEEDQNRHEATETYAGLIKAFNAYCEFFGN